MVPPEPNLGTIFLAWGWTRSSVARPVGASRATSFFRLCSVSGWYYFCLCPIMVPLPLVHGSDLISLLIDRNPFFDGYIQFNGRVFRGQQQSFKYSSMITAIVCFIQLSGNVTNLTTGFMMLISFGHGNVLTATDIYEAALEHFQECCCKIR